MQQTAQHITVEYPDYPRADYTRNALEGKLSIATTSKITLEEYKRRIVTMLRCYRAIDRLDNKSDAHIVSFKIVNPGDAELEQAEQRRNVELNGPIYRIAGFNQTTAQNESNVSEPTPTDASKHYVRYQVRENWVVFIGSGNFALMRRKIGDGSQRQSNWRLMDV